MVTSKGFQFGLYQMYSTAITILCVQVTSNVFHSYNYIVCAGDGVGPEICESVTTIFKEMAVPVEFETIELTKHTLNDEGSFNMAITSLKRNGVGLKGKINFRS